MPSCHLILCRPLFLLPPIPPSIRVFSNESTLRMRWPEYWSFSFSIIPFKEIPGLISFRISLSGEINNNFYPFLERVHVTYGSRFIYFSPLLLIFSCRNYEFINKISHGCLDDRILSHFINLVVKPSLLLPSMIALLSERPFHRLLFIMW